MLDSYRKIQNLVIERIQIIIMIILTLSFISCNITENNDTEKQWVYIEINTVSKTDSTDYFLYGQINKSILKKINKNENTNGLFILSNTRFTNDDNLLEIYEDELLSGKLVFRIQDIEEIKFYNDDPVLLFNIDELHESAKLIRNKSSN
ncbi:MAG: hypothetical protein ACWA5P_04765 [bacterium]